MRYTNQNTFLYDPLPTIPPPDLTSNAIAVLQFFLQNLPSKGIDGDESEAMAVMDFAVCVEIRPADAAVIDFSADDNELCSPLAIALPPIDFPPPTPEVGGFQPHFPNPSHPLSSGDRFRTKGGGSAFGSGLDFGVVATADYRGYIEELRGDIPVTIFGFKFDFMNVTVRAQLVPDYAGKPADEESGCLVELRFLNKLLNSDELPFQPDSPPLQSIPPYSKSAPDPEVEQQFFVGPIPLVTGASVAGNFGVKYGLVFTVPSPGEDTTTDGVDYSFTNQVSPFAKYTVPKVVTCSWGFVKGRCIKNKTIKRTKNLKRCRYLAARRCCLWCWA